MLWYFFDLSPLFSPCSRRCPSLSVCLRKAVVSSRVACVIKIERRKGQTRAQETVTPWGWVTEERHGCVSLSSPILSHSQGDSWLAAGYSGTAKGSQSRPQHTFTSKILHVNNAYQILKLIRLQTPICFRNISDKPFGSRMCSVSRVCFTRKYTFNSVC